MDRSLIENITKSPLRQSLYHFTRASNLESMANGDALYAAAVLAPEHSGGKRRAGLRPALYGGRTILLNAHLRIVPEAMDPDTTEEEFRRCLDCHVFLWATLRHCKAMAAMYARREPDETFAILQLTANELLLDHWDAVKLSKYDSGSSPRYPHRSAYRKSCRMFLPLERFKAVQDPLVPVKPSEIKEVLVEGKLAPVSKYLQAVYCQHPERVPSAWKALTVSGIIPLK